MRAIPAFAAVMLMAGCSSDPNGPDNGTLLGRFGNAEQHAELVACTPRRSCSSSADRISPFRGRSGSRPISPSASPASSTQSGFGIPSGPIDAVAVGSYDTSSGTVNMHLEMAGDDPFPYALRSGESGELDKVVCALSVQAR
jgi:hypothetical protein